MKIVFKPHYNHNLYGQNDSAKLTLNHFTDTVLHSPGKELESLTTKVPGGLSFNRLIASSLEIEGLYQNWEESRTNTGCDFSTSPPSEKRGRGRDEIWI